jgi:broad specificity phosphatase PhoE
MVCVVLSACAEARAQRAVILVRHAEKETDPAVLNGRPDLAVPLSAAGKERAKALADRLKDAGVTAIYTSPADRTKQTAGPLADVLGITPKVIGRGDLDAMPTAHAGGVVVIVGHSNTVAGMIDRLMGREVGVEIGEENFGGMFVVLPGEKPALIRSRY